jgi:hypothetical protein
MGLSNLGEQISLNRIFSADQAPVVSSVQAALGPVASTPVKYFIHLHATTASGATAPTEQDMGTLYTGSANSPGVVYAAQEIVFTPKTFSTTTTPNIISLTTTVTFTTSAASNWADIAYYTIHACASAAVAATANMIFYGTFATPAVVGLGDTVQIVSGGTGLAIAAE